MDFMLTTDMIAEVNKFGGKSECSKLNGAGESEKALWAAPVGVLWGWAP